MKIVGVIPARWGSTRFPGKSLALLCGKPVIQWVYERASEAVRLDSVTVATDDDRIRKAVESFGGVVAMTSGAHPSGTDRIAEAVGGTDADIAINIQGDEPFIESALIDELAEVMAADSSWDMATAAAPIDNESDLQNPSVVKVVCGDDGQALLFSRSTIPFDRDGKYSVADLLYWRHLGIYAYRMPFLKRLVSAPPCRLEEVEKLEQLRALCMGARIKVIGTRNTGTGIDTPEDLCRAEDAVRQRRKGTQ